MKRSLILAAAALVFVFGSAPPSMAEEPWDAGFVDIAVLQADLSSHAVWVQASQDGKKGWKEQEYTVVVERTAPSGWSLTSIQKAGESRTVLDSQLRLVRESQSILDTDLSKRMGMDKMDWKIAGSDATFTVFSGGKEKSSKTFKLDRDISFLSILSVQMQALLAGGRLESRSLGLMFGDRKVDALVRFLPLSNPLSLVEKGIAIPPGLGRVLPSGDYIVADFALTGVFKVVYPHHFYFVYRKDRAWRFVASWSGKPSEVQFSWMVR